MSRYTKGMKDGAEPFKGFFDDESESLHEEMDNIREKIDALGENFSNVFDYLDMDESQRAEFIKEVKDRNIRNKKPAKFKINIVYLKKEDVNFADNLRISLHNQGNSSRIQQHNDYKMNTQLNDYTIFIGDPDVLINGQSKKIFSNHGMKICVNANNDIIACYNGKIEDWDREPFIDYYSNSVKEVINNSKKAMKASKALKKRKKHENDATFFELCCDGQEKILYKFEDFVDNFAEKNLFCALSTIPIMVVYGLFAVLSLVLLLPVGITENAASDLVDKMKNSNFDKEFIAEAQRQILQIKLCEYISIEQLRLAK